MLLTNALRRRDGFTMVEMMITLVLFGIVAAGLLGVLAKQQRFYRGTEDVLERRRELRTAAVFAPIDLRGLSGTGGDVRAMSDSSVTMLATIGSGVICTTPTATTFIVPPTYLASGNVLTAWSSMPTSGDSVAIFDDVNPNINTDDLWRTYQISAITPGAGACPNSSGFTQSADNASNSYTVTITGGTIPVTITAGSPVRFLRHEKYALFKAADNAWYLGFCARTCSGSDALSAVAGPLRPYATGGTSGLSFQYYDSLGATTATTTRVARIKMTVRTKTGRRVELEGTNTGGSPQAVTDSLTITLGLRNRS